MKRIYLWLFLWFGSKLFKYVDVYTPDKEIITSITFTNNSTYLDRVLEIEN